MNLNDYWALSTSDVCMCRLFVSAGQCKRWEKKDNYLDSTMREKETIDCWTNKECHKYDDDHNE